MANIENFQGIDWKCSPFYTLWQLNMDFIVVKNTAFL